ncbi:outer membrane protein assembly factor BamD [candidate division KSB1 bacterium]|nr:tetratricopeptide repeat protein [candidate division KSB1 bacterium]RQW02078.1 MAG: outer membrane protein assembly factor BamD [candidate division KSB1 bacterium]
MSKKISAVFFVIAAFVFTSSEVIAQEEENKPTFGIGLNAGLQMPDCDIQPAGVALAGEGFMRFLLSDRVNIQLGLGYGELSDGFSKRTFHTTIYNADLKGNIYLKKTGAFRPYASLGFGAINYTYNKDRLEAVEGDIGLSGKALWDVAFIFGGGIDLMLSEKVALNAMGDYRHTTTDGLDGVVQGKARDGYWNARLGLVFFTGKKTKAVEEELIAEESVSAQVEEPQAETTPGEADDETADILALLMGTQVETKETPAADVAAAAQDTSDLQKRVSNLKTQISGKEEEIATLEDVISSRDARIFELQRELDQVDKFAGDFSSAYKEGLRLYSIRKHDESISIFKSLFSRYPQHKLVSNCTYWLGENYFLKGDYTSAIEAFNAVFDYESSYKFDDATLMLGRCYQKLGQKNQAVSYFEKLITQYPESEYVPKAQQWLGRLR